MTMMVMTIMPMAVTMPIFKEVVMMMPMMLITSWTRAMKQLTIMVIITGAAELMRLGA